MVQGPFLLRSSLLGTLKFDEEITKRQLVSLDFFLRVNIDTMAEAWRGGIGEYPPNPERLAIPPDVRRRSRRTRGVLLNLEG